MTISELILFRSDLIASFRLFPNDPVISDLLGWIDEAVALLRQERIPGKKVVSLIGGVARTLDDIPRGLERLTE